MGINRPSMYAAFGNREQLYCKTLNRYSKSRSERLNEFFAAPTARESVELLFRETVEDVTDPKNPGGGCFRVQGARGHRALPEVESQAELTVLASTLGRSASINLTHRELVFVSDRRSRAGGSPAQTKSCVLTRALCCGPRTAGGVSNGAISSVAGRYDESPLTSWVTAEEAEGAVGSRAVTFRRACHYRPS